MGLKIYSKAIYDICHSEILYQMYRNVFMNMLMNEDILSLGHHLFYIFIWL